MILTSGVFDGLHRGHLGYLQAAKAIDPTQPLCVAVASDDYVRHHKGRAPAFSLDDRIAVVFGLSCVDWVVSHDASGAAHAIYTQKPRWFVKGEDWRGQLPDAIRAACQLVGCDIQYVNSGSSVHTADALSALHT